MSDKPSLVIRTVTLVGLGKMGRQMAMRLLAAGFPLICYDRGAAMLEPLLKAGATGAATLQDAVRGADAVIRMLPDGRAVRDAMLGLFGAAEVMKKGSLLIDMSSSTPMGVRALGEDMLKMGIEMIDAPVSGCVAKAVGGLPVIMAGGDPDQVERARPLLESLSNKIFHAGGLGSGHAIKVLNTSGFAIALMSKDLRTATDLALQLDPLSRSGMCPLCRGRRRSGPRRWKTSGITSTAPGFPSFSNMPLRATRRGAGLR